MKNSDKQGFHALPISDSIILIGKEEKMEKNGGKMKTFYICPPQSFLYLQVIRFDLIQNSISKTKTKDP